ncbi:MAG: helix-turn-helix domain-containing protein [Myxococcales bacterium]|nr:helix-turn-helix domain-containing protein [Myxococcales bacterium]
MDTTSAALSLREYITVAEAASLYGVNPQTIRRWIGQGAPCVRRGRVVRVPVDDLRTWLSTTTEPNPSQHSARPNTESGR